MDEIETYYLLVNKIKQLGERRPKRHGEYIRVSLFDGYALELDTWNNSIYVYIEDRFIESLGIDFGGFKCNLTMVKFWYAHLNNK